MISQTQEFGKALFADPVTVVVNHTVCLRPLSLICNMLASNWGLWWLALPNSTIAVSCRIGTECVEVSFYYSNLWIWMEHDKKIRCSEQTALGQWLLRDHWFPQWYHSS